MKAFGLSEVAEKEMRRIAQEVYDQNSSKKDDTLNQSRHSKTIVTHKDGMYTFDLFGTGLYVYTIAANDVFSAYEGFMKFISIDVSEAITNSINMK